jgi:hypothetical protein
MRTRSALESGPCVAGPAHLGLRIQRNDTCARVKLVSFQQVQFWTGHISPSNRVGQENVLMRIGGDAHFASVYAEGPA